MIDFLYLNILILVLYILEKLIAGKISRRLQYALWLLIPIYLLTCIMNVNDLSDSVMAVSPKLAHNLVKLEVRSAHVVNCVVAMTLEYLTAKGISVKVDAFYIFRALRYGIAIVFACVFLLYNVVFSVRCIRRRRFYKQDKQTGMKIYLLDYPQTPFLLGRGIYVHPDMTQNEKLLHHAICHEYSHYKQGDFVWTLLRYLFLIYYWFDPIVWLVVSRIRQDSELSCDERVISILGEESQVAYAVSLITLMNNERNKIKFDVTATMGGKKKQLKERVEAISKIRKRSILVTGIVTACIVVTASCIWFGVVKNSKQDKAEPVFIWNGTKVEREEIAKVTLYHFVENVSYPEVDITEDVLAGKAVLLTMPGQYMVIVTTKAYKRVDISDCSTDETAYSKGLLPSNVINIGGDNK